MKTKRPLGLVLIVFGKAAKALSLTIIAIILILAGNKYQSLVKFADVYIFSDYYPFEDRIEPVEKILGKLIRDNKSNLQIGSIITEIYAILIVIEAIGLWYRRQWAKRLVLGMVGISIPLEVFELIREITLLKLGIFLLNLAVLWYLLHHFSKNDT